MNGRTALLVALGIDQFGAGLFLPLSLVYATLVVGLPLPVAAAAVTVGTVVGLVVPPMAGRLVDRVGARWVVVAAQVVQATGARRTCSRAAQRWCSWARRCWPRGCSASTVRCSP